MYIREVVHDEGGFVLALVVDGFEHKNETREMDPTQVPG